MAYQNLTGVKEGLGSAIVNRAVTATLYVSPNGDNSDGSSWTKAYQTIQGALAVASTDVNECTLIVIGIGTGANHYNIDTTGDPTFTGNYILKGSCRNWVKVMNDHASATSILKFTGYTALLNLNFNLGESNNGVIITKGAGRLYHCQFVGQNLTGAKTALHFDGASVLKHTKVIDCHFRGNVSYMIGVLIDNSESGDYKDLVFLNCLKAVQIVNSNSNYNRFKNIVIGESAIGFDIDAGSGQHLWNSVFYDNVLNVDDEVGDHIMYNTTGSFNMAVEPADMTGITLAAGALADEYGADTELRAAATSTVPFRLIATYIEPQVAQWYTLRLSSDSGVTFFDQIMVSSAKAAGNLAPSGTEHIFNKGTRISGSLKAESGGSDTVKVWLKIQEV